LNSFVAWAVNWGREILEKYLQLTRAKKTASSSSSSAATNGMKCLSIQPFENTLSDRCPSQSQKEERNAIVKISSISLHPQ
jgi:hypothetical protein